MGWRGVLTKLDAQAIHKFGRLIKNDLEPGERHGVLLLPDGSYQRASYLGPGTQVLKRYKRGDKGKTPVDAVAKQHDRDYSIAKTPEDITRADHRMIASVNNIQRRGLDSPFNILQAKAINLKYAAEAIAGHNALGFGGTPGDAEHQSDSIALKGKGAPPGPQYGSKQTKKPNNKKPSILQMLRGVKKRRRNLTGR